MPAATIEALQSVLSPYDSRFRAIIERAWARWDRLPAWTRLSFHFSRTRAGCIWAFIAEEARAEFANDPDVRPIDDPATCMFVLRDAVVVRFKKLDESGASRNFPTKRSLRFNGQQDIDGIPSELPRVDVGYVENRLGTGFAQVKVSHRCGNRVDWHYAIETEAQVVEMPLRSEPGTSRIRRRGTAQLKLETGTEGGEGK